MSTFPDVEFKCPFCGKQCGASMEPEPSVTHELPMCREFAEADPDEFLMLVNVAMGNREAGIT